MKHADIQPREICEMQPLQLRVDGQPSSLRVLLQAAFSIRNQVQAAVCARIEDQVAYFMDRLQVLAP